MMAIEKLPDIGYIIDKLERIEAERTLISPSNRDFDSYLFMYNTVVELVDVVPKINEIIDSINAGGL